MARRSITPSRGEPLLQTKQRALRLAYLPGRRIVVRLPRRDESMRCWLSRGILASSLLSLCIGCTCRDYMYLYHFKGQLVDETGNPAPSTRVRLQMRTEQPTFHRPEVVGDWWYTGWLASGPSGQVMYTYGGDKWGSCCGRKPPAPPAIANLLVSSDGGPEQWIAIPPTQIHQSCGGLECEVDIGAITVTKPR